MSNLAPCPGCGCTDQLDHCDVGGWIYVLCSVRCSRCGWRSGAAFDADSAARRWNRRAPALRWRRDPPDVPGWWWHRRTGANADLVYYDELHASCKPGRGCRRRRTR